MSEVTVITKAFGHRTVELRKEQEYIALVLSLTWNWVKEMKMRMKLIGQDDRTNGEIT